MRIYKERYGNRDRYGQRWVNIGICTSSRARIRIERERDRKSKKSKKSKKFLTSKERDISLAISIYISLYD